MASDSTIASIDEQQNILRQQASAALAKSRAATTEEARQAALAERDGYNQQIKALEAQRAAVVPNDPSKDTYAGVDENSGKDKYYNPTTGQLYLSDTIPSSAQRRAYNTTVDSSGVPIEQLITDNNVTPQKTDPPADPPVATPATPVQTELNTTLPPVGEATQTTPTTKRVVSVNVADDPGVADPAPAAEPVAKTEPQGIFSNPTYPSQPQPEQPAEQKQVSTAGDGAAVVNPQIPAEQSAVNEAPTPLLTQEESIAKAQQTLPNDAQNGADALRKGQTGDAVETTNTPVSKEQAPVDPKVEPTAQQSILGTITNKPVSGSGGVAGSVDAVKVQTAAAVASTQREENDWRVRLQLSPSANYLYYSPTLAQNDLLYPLRKTEGVIFPYTPQINVTHKANYDPVDITHTNYKSYFYKNSSTDEVTIVADFTAQDTTEAFYMLAVIHFFRSVTKMFYGQDSNPRAGTPPPLCYLTGLGQFQYSNHPLVISSFQYNLPNDVDYIRAGAPSMIAGVNMGGYTDSQKGYTGKYSPGLDRLRGSGLTRGGITGYDGAIFNTTLANAQSTYVPTKIQLSITGYPIVTRKNITDQFSLEKYASGALIKKGFW